jgi:uncharacterized protein YkwD
MRFIRGPAAGALFLLAGCTAETPPLAAPAPPPDPKTQMAALERRIFELVEDERHKLNPVARPLALDLELVGVAREKSADMAAKSYVAHAAPDGETTATIIMDKDAAFQGLLGENIASQPFLPTYGVDVEAFAQRIVQTWTTSSQHRDNLAYPPYDRTGVGAAVSRDTIYVTELFASSLGLTPPSGLRRPSPHVR